MGSMSNVEGTFLEGNAIHSLDAAILYLPMGFPLFLSWLAAPYHWTMIAGITIGSLLLFGLWLADTLELILLFSSWIFLALTVLLPVHWPWFIILPLALAIVSTSRYTILLAILLTMGTASGILLLALAEGMAQPGACDDRLTSAHMGMDNVLYCHLADGTSRGNRATVVQIDPEFPLLTSSFTVATLLAWTEEADLR